MHILTLEKYKSRAIALLLLKTYGFLSSFRPHHYSIDNDLHSMNLVLAGPVEAPDVADALTRTGLVKASHLATQE